MVRRDSDALHTREAEAWSRIQDQEMELSTARRAAQEAIVGKATAEERSSKMEELCVASEERDVVKKDAAGQARELNEACPSLADVERREKVVREAYGEKSVPAYQLVLSFWAALQRPGFLSTLRATTWMAVRQVWLRSAKALSSSSPRSLGLPR